MWGGTFKGVINNRMDNRRLELVSSHQVLCHQTLNIKTKEARVGRNYRSPHLRTRIKIAICGGDERKIKELVNCMRTWMSPGRPGGWSRTSWPPWIPTTILNVVSFEEWFGLNISASQRCWSHHTRVDGVVSKGFLNWRPPTHFKIDEEPPNPVQGARGSRAWGRSSPRLRRRSSSTMSRLDLGGLRLPSTSSRPMDFKHKSTHYNSSCSWFYFLVYCCLSKKILTTKIQQNWNWTS